MKPHIYLKRRTAVAATMAVESRLVLAGNSELERTNDTPYPFRQSNNFLYLTGISQPDALLVLHKNQDGVVAEQLYIAQLHPFMEVWEGRSNKLDQLRDTSGIADIQEYTAIKELILDLPQIVYIDMPDSANTQIAAWQLWDHIKQTHPDTELTAINPEITTLRVIKDQHEIACIQKAIDDTSQALQHVGPLLIPGVTEQAIAAEFVRFASERGLEQAWPPIVSFGKNSCTIHHTPDTTKLVDGDLVLFDVGLEVEGYAADISRMVQIGEASDRQKQVLQAVSKVQRQAIGLIKPGIKFDEYEKQVGDIMAQQLVELGLFTSLEQANEPDTTMKWPAYRRYFSHRTSHFLGLDAHDVGDRNAEFIPGMVLTCEPGIYIAEEGIGVRLEDDILITKDGATNLTANVSLSS